MNITPAPAATKQGWKVPELPRRFALDDAVNKAFERAGTYMNKVLLIDDLSVELAHDKDNDEILGIVRDRETGEQMSAYKGMQLLKLYAQNKKNLGVIVDGNV